MEPTAFEPVTSALQARMHTPIRPQLSVQLGPTEGLPCGIPEAGGVDAGDFGRFPEVPADRAGRHDRRLEEEAHLPPELPRAGGPT